MYKEHNIIASENKIKSLWLASMFYSGPSSIDSFKYIYSKSHKLYCKTNSYVTRPRKNNQKLLKVLSTAANLFFSLQCSEGYRRLQKKHTTMPQTGQLKQIPLRNTTRTQIYSFLSPALPQPLISLMHMRFCRPAIPLLSSHCSLWNNTALINF